MKNILFLFIVGFVCNSCHTNTTPIPVPPLPDPKAACKKAFSKLTIAEDSIDFVLKYKETKKFAYNDIEFSVSLDYMGQGCPLRNCFGCDAFDGAFATLKFTANMDCDSLKKIRLWSCPNYIRSVCEVKDYPHAYPVGRIGELVVAIRSFQPIARGDSALTALNNNPERYSANVTMVKNCK